MDSLPVELLTPICFLACTDGGPTACSLSLVSHRIHAVSRPARYHSVAFSGPRILTAVPHFLARLKEEHEDRKRATAASRVRHLFVSVLPPLGELQTMVWKLYVYTVTTLLRAVAQDVETLSLVFSPWGAGPIKPIELDVEFPRLQELTASGVSFSAPQLGSPAFPAVRRLHLLSGPCLREWTSLTPNVTHLRLSEVPDLVVEPGISFKGLQLFVRKEPETLWLPTLTADPETQDSAPVHYPNLQQVVVQPSSLPRSRGLGFYKDFVEWLWTSQPTARVPMYLVPADRGVDVDQRAKQERCSAKAKDLWLAGVEGSPRCWEPDEKYAHLERLRGEGMPLYMRPWAEEWLDGEGPSGVGRTEDIHVPGTQGPREDPIPAASRGGWRRRQAEAWVSVRNARIPATRAPAGDMQAIERESERLESVSLGLEPGDS